MEAKEILKKVINYINRGMDPEITPDMLDENGAIYYRNGNDGTKWDWEENDRTCEFMNYYKSTGYGCVKAFVQSDGYIVGYFYPEEGRGEEIVHLEPEFIGEKEAEDFKNFLNLKFDLFQRWNKDVKEALN